MIDKTTVFVFILSIFFSVPPSQITVKQDINIAKQRAPDQVQGSDPEELDGQNHTRIRVEWFTLRVIVVFSRVSNDLAFSLLYIFLSSDCARNVAEEES